VNYARRAAQLGILYGRHVRTDLRTGTTPSHLVRDAGRFLRLCFPSRAVSRPPHDVSAYRAMLERLLREPLVGFRSLPEHIANPVPADDRVWIVIRHDLDAGRPDIAAALCAAELATGLRSSVHILVDGAFYDPRVLASIARELHGQGFDVGLHTQAWMYENYEHRFLNELQAFERLFGFAPRTFTHHGAWPRTSRDLRRRREFTHRTPQMILGTSIIGYVGSFDWVSEDSGVNGAPAPLRREFFYPDRRCYLGGTALVLTHDNWWGAAQV
jgi:hypothetical protein